MSSGFIQHSTVDKAFTLTFSLLTYCRHVEISKTNTVSTRLDAHLSSARNPMFGPKVIVKYDVTQLESCLSILPISLGLALTWLETHCVSTRVDTVYQDIFAASNMWTANMGGL